MSAMTDAIAAHRAAWQAFQDAPPEPGRIVSQAEDDESDAMGLVLCTVPGDIADVLALKEHLDWYVVEESRQFDAAPKRGVISNLPFAFHAALTIALGAR